MVINEGSYEGTISLIKHEMAKYTFVSRFLIDRWQMMFPTQIIPSISLMRLGMA
jgi:hypothetical protein